MVLARYKPFSEPTVTPEATQAVPSPYAGITQENAYDSKISLLRYVEGASWTVNYYRQVIATHNDLRAPDKGQDGVYQNYEEIIGLEIKVSSPLSQGSQDQDTGLMNVEGSGLIYPQLIPNVGDVFIADSGDGRDALFLVTSVNRSSFRKDSVFQIDYILKYYIDPNGTTLKDLKNKTVQTFFFEKDMLLNNKTPLLIEDEYKFMKEATISYFEMVNYYFNTFYDKEFSTLIVPGQSDKAVYDPFVTDFILRITNTNESMNIRRVKLLITLDDEYLNQPQLYSILLNRSIHLLDQANQQMGLTSPLYFAPDSHLRGIRYTYISDLIYPINPDTTMNQKTDLSPKPINATTLIQTQSAKNIYSISNELYVEGTLSIPYIYPVLEDEYYVFTENFYKNLDQKSILESLTRDYLKQKAIDVKRMWPLLKRWHQFNRLEQFYYLPILILLTKAARWGIK